MDIVKSMSQAYLYCQNEKEISRYFLSADLSYDSQYILEASLLYASYSPLYSLTISIISR